MSAEVIMRAAVFAALRADAALMAQVNALFDGEPARASAPHVVVGECIGADWGGKDVSAREVRLNIALVDSGETPERLAGMMARVDAVLGAVPVREGWRIVTARLVRSRVARVSRQPGSGWQAVVDYRLRGVWEG